MRLTLCFACSQRELQQLASHPLTIRQQRSLRAGSPYIRNEPRVPTPFRFRKSEIGVATACATRRGQWWVG